MEVAGFQTRFRFTSHYFRFLCHHSRNGRTLCIHILPLCASCLNYPRGLLHTSEQLFCAIGYQHMSSGNTFIFRSRVNMFLKSPVPKHVFVLCVRSRCRWCRIFCRRSFHCQTTMYFRRISVCVLKYIAICVE